VTSKEPSTLLPRIFLWRFNCVSTTIQESSTFPYVHQWWLIKRVDDNFWRSREFDSSSLIKDWGNIILNIQYGNWEGDVSDYYVRTKEIWELPNHVLCVLLLLFITLRFIVINFMEFYLEL
jgi:hypothetical protein